MAETLLFLFSFFFPFSTFVENGFPNNPVLLALPGNNPTLNSLYTSCADGINLSPRIGS